MAKNTVTVYPSRVRVDLGGSPHPVESIGDENAVMGSLGCHIADAGPQGRTRAHQAPSPFLLNHGMPWCLSRVRLELAEAFAPNPKASASFSTLSIRMSSTSSARQYRGLRSPGHARPDLGA